MNTYDSVLRRGLTGWDQEKIPKTELERRLDLIRTEMKARGIGVLIIHGDSWKYGDLCYATHYSPMTREGVALIPLEGDPVLYLSLGSRDIPFHQELTWIEEVTTLPTLTKELAGRLQAWGVQGSPIGMVDVLENMRDPLYEAIRAQTRGSALLPCTEWYRKLRLLKSPAEIPLLKEATGIADFCFQEILRYLNPGLREFELAAQADYAARAHGAEDCRILLTSGSDTDRFLRPAGDRKIGPGEKVTVYLALAYQRYWTELGRTIVVGGPNRQENLVLEETTKLYEQIVQSVGPGQGGLSSMAQAFHALQAHQEKHQAQSSVILQGIGLDREEDPRIPISPTPSPLTPGMFLSARLTQFGPGVGAFFSEPLLVGANGCEILTRTERRLYQAT